jgi:hypothetical protein
MGQHPGGRPPRGPDDPESITVPHYVDRGGVRGLALRCVASLRRIEDDIVKTSALVLLVHPSSVSVVIPVGSVAGAPSACCALRRRCVVSCFAAASSLTGEPVTVTSFRKARSCNCCSGLGPHPEAVGSRSIPNQRLPGAVPDKSCAAPRTGRCTDLGRKGPARDPSRARKTGRRHRRW